jgi:A/G-specific adenine glycosylase
MGAGLITGKRPREAEIVKIILEWYSKNKRRYPWRESTDPYKVLIAEMMLQRTNAEQVVPIFLRFIEKYPHPHCLASSNLSEIEELLKSLGLKWRTKKIWEMANALVKDFNGKIPSNLEDLLKLPGVGNYIAHAVLCFAFKRDVPVIDANICRVVSRLFNIMPKGEGRRDKKIIRKINQLHSYVPHGFSRKYNWAMLDFAAQICTPRKPNCKNCIVRALCKYPYKGL